MKKNKSKRFLIAIIFLSVYTAGVYFYAGESLEGTYINPSVRQIVNQKNIKEKPVTRLLLIGDAGDPSLIEKEPVLETLQKKASELPGITSILFLGDNIYPDGLHEEGHDERQTSERKLLEQVKVIEESSTKGFFIPGNHDWDHNGEAGWGKILSQVRFFDSLKLKQVSFIPKGGCPGPEVVDLNGKVRLIILDTQWWLHEYGRPEDGDKICFPCTEQAIIDSLDSSIKNADGKFVIVAGHHPVDSYGQHGGYFEWKDHIFPLRHINENLWIPLPVLGSLYPLARNFGVTTQDISNSKYQNLKLQLEKVFEKYPASLLYVTGHEHTLQVLNGIADNYYLISGYGTSTHREGLRTGERSLFAGSYPGFMQVDFFADGKIKLDVIKPSAPYKNPEIVLSFWIKE